MKYLACLLALALAACWPQPSRANIYNVTNTADGAGTVSPIGGGTFNASTLRAAVTAANAAVGSHSINVPPGTYRLKAWHERLPSQTREITVPETGEVKADFVLGIKNLPRP